MPLNYAAKRLSVLNLLAENKAPLSLADIHQALHGDPLDLSAVLKNMAEDGLIKERIGANNYAITSRGREECAALKEQLIEERAKRAREESQQRFDNKISVLNILVPLITFLFGLFVEHYAGLLRFLSR